MAEIIILSDDFIEVLVEKLRHSKKGVDNNSWLYIICSSVVNKTEISDGFTDEEIKTIDKEIKEIINACAEYAKDSPEVSAEELWTDVYA